MLTTAPRVYGVADPAEVRQITGREFLQAMLDGRLPTPPIMKSCRSRSRWRRPCRV
jgi:hypothetical protein